MNADKNSPLPKWTRREMVRAGSLSLAGAAMFPLKGAAEAKESQDDPKGKEAKTPSKKAQAPSDDSVFNHCVPKGYKQHDGNTKYAKGDVAHTFPVYALWLMLTTENWETLDCETPQPNWWTDLFEELFQAYAKGNPNADLDNDRRILLVGDPSKNQKPILQMLRSHMLKDPDTLTAIRNLWDNFINQASIDFYGGRPCPGGGTIVQIAGLTPIDRGQRSVAPKKRTPVRK